MSDRLFPRKQLPGCSVSGRPIRTNLTLDDAHHPDDPDFPDLSRINEPDGLDVDAVLGDAGLIARRLTQYESRPQQLKMAAAVQAAIMEEEHLVVEAGTGVGKSFGYLVPAILAITDTEFRQAESPKREAERHGRVVISTHTISLQEQLMSKDLPFLNSILPREFSAVLVKGRGNYISLRRLEQALGRSVGLFETQSDLMELGKIRTWAQTTSDGSLADLSFKPSAAVWDEVASDASNCLGRKCPTHEKCFYFQARRRAAQAQVLVVNHALFFTDLALREDGANVLPDYDAVILDEAHTMEAVAADHLGLGVTSGQISYRLNRLYNSRSQKGLLVEHDLVNLQQEVLRIQSMADSFFETCLDWYREHQPSKSAGGGRSPAAAPAPAAMSEDANLTAWDDLQAGCLRVRSANIVPNRLSKPLKHLSQQLLQIAEQSQEPGNQKNFQSAAEGLANLALRLDNWCDQSDESWVYWLETRRRRSGWLIALMAAPIDVGRVLRRILFARTPSVVMTSATLATGGERLPQGDELPEYDGDSNRAGFNFFTSRIGVQMYRPLKLGSPFSYPDQAELIITPDLPPPDAGAAYDQACLQAARYWIDRHAGHTFILFTSYAALTRMQRQLEPWLRQRGLLLYSQADGIPRSRLVEDFRANPKGVLLGTDSFWQGVDVPGSALTHVMIPKLPFSVPDHPLLEARLDAIRQAGGNPFTEYQLPEAVIKFKQGFGRLIRSAHDHGQVVVLDSRILTKFYGRIFLESLPNVPIRRASYRQWH